MKRPLRALLPIAFAVHTIPATSCIQIGRHGVPLPTAAPDTDAAAAAAAVAPQSPGPKTKALKPKPWRDAVTINYSAANEYVGAHYAHYGYGGGTTNCGGGGGGSAGDGDDQSEASSPPPPYFAHASQSDRTPEPVHDAREGYYDDRTGELQEPTLEGCGFALRRMPTGAAATMDDGADWAMDAKTKYLPELRKLIEDAFRDERTDEISHVMFWHPMLRGEDVAMSASTAPVASLVHIDTDIGAHDADGIVRLVENNRVEGVTSGDGGSDGDSDEDPFPTEEIVDALRSGRRFAVVNAWRSADQRRRPVGRAPLGLLAPRYGSDCDGVDYKNGYNCCYPAARPVQDRSRWYVYPRMEPDEVLLFKQFDRRLDRISDLWHCALPIAEEGAPPRRSFDVRALVVFRDGVPLELDRFSDDRPRPTLTLHESGCFCDTQADKRGASSEMAMDQNLFSS